MASQNPATICPKKYLRFLMHYKFYMKENIAGNVSCSGQTSKQ